MPVLPIFHFLKDVLASGKVLEMKTIDITIRN